MMITIKIGPVELSLWLIFIKNLTIPTNEHGKRRLGSHWTTRVLVAFINYLILAEISLELDILIIYNLLYTDLRYP
jgi:multisubunit Na+/H+ antiporter MnhB subunit